MIRELTCECFLADDLKKHSRKLLRVVCIIEDSEVSDLEGWFIPIVRSTTGQRRISSLGCYNAEWAAIDACRKYLDRVRIPELVDVGVYQVWKGELRFVESGP